MCFQVVRAAEEAASTLASSIHPEQCIKVLCPIIQTADYPINLAAIKMQTKVIERISKESLHQILQDIIPGLLQVTPHPPPHPPGGVIWGSILNSGGPSKPSVRRKLQSGVRYRDLVCDARRRLPVPSSFPGGASCRPQRSVLQSHKVMVTLYSRFHIISVSLRVSTT